MIIYHFNAYLIKAQWRDNYAISDPGFAGTLQKESNKDYKLFSWYQMQGAKSVLLVSSTSFKVLLMTAISNEIMSF